MLHIAHLKPYHPSPIKFGDRIKLQLKKRRDKGLEDWEIIEITEESYDPPDTQKPGKRKKITKKGIQKGKKTLYYRGKWVYPSGEIKWSDDWVPAKNFINAPEVLRQWESIKTIHPEKRAQ